MRDVKYINKVLNKVTTTAYSEMAKKAPWAWGTVYFKSQEGPLAKISTTSNKIMSLKLYKLLEKYQPDIIISTHPFASQMCGHLKNKEHLNIKIYTIMTDFAPHEQWLVEANHTDGIFVAHSGMKNALIEKGLEPNKIHVTGIPVSSRFQIKYNRDEIFKKYNLNSKKTTVLFFAGGEFGLGKNVPYEVLKNICEHFPNLQVIAVSGKNQKMQKLFNKLVQTYHKENSIKVIGYSREVPELMCISDAVITKPGGLTTSESLISNIPMLIINPIPGQEEENATFLENHNVAIWLKKHDNIYEVLNRFFNTENLLDNMKNETKKIAKINSTRDICNIILGKPNKKESF